MKNVYLDHAATTYVSSKAIEVMHSVLLNNFGNPSSTHSFGRSGKALVETSRKKIANTLHVSASEIIFTSGGTEANNFVLQGAVHSLGVKRIITSAIEHHAVLTTIAYLKTQFGVAVEYVKLKDDGVIDLENLEELLQQSHSKTLVSLMHINNETGVMLPLKKVSDLCKNYQALFHSDTVQTIGHFNLDLQDVSVDFITASAHKFHGPKGVGFVFVRKNIVIQPLLYGGEQERGSRAGTEAVHQIAGMAEAFTAMYNSIEANEEQLQTVKQYFVSELKLAIPEIAFNANSDRVEGVTPTVLNVRFPFNATKGSTLLFQLDLQGIACSAGSACQSGSNQISHVLKAILSEEELKQPSLRFSFAETTTKEEIDYVVGVLAHIANN